MLGDNDLHGESEAVSADEFDIFRQSGGLYSTGPSVDGLPDKSRKDVDSQLGSDDDDDSEFNEKSYNEKPCGR